MQSNADTPLRCVLASVLLLGLPPLVLLHVLFPHSVPLWWAGLCTWGALAFILSNAPSRGIRQFVLLALAGLVFLGIAWWRRAELSLTTLLAQNSLLLAMLYGVGYLRLVASLGQDADERLPQGKGAFLKTLLGVQALGAVINISIVVLAAERLKAEQALGREAVMILAKAFSMAALWSPFFAALAVALTYAPEAQLYPTLLTGLGIAVLAVGVCAALMGGFKLQRVATFRGYPTHFSSLLIPLLLAVAVLVLHELLPQVSILVIVSCSAISLTLLMLLWHLPWQEATQRFSRQALTASQRMVNELSLFLGAAVLTVGLQAFAATLGNFLPLDSFNGFDAGLLLGAAVLLSWVGVHPIISIAVSGPLLTPLQPEPNLLALLFLAIWSLGIASSPFSGLVMVLRTQSGFSGQQILRWNMPYIVAMWAVITLVFTLLFP